MLNTQTLKSITDMRKDADGLLQLTHRLRQPVGILKNNQLKAYLLDAETYEALQAFVEDYQDQETIHHRLVQKKSEDWQDFHLFWNQNNIPIPRSSTVTN